MAGKRASVNGVEKVERVGKATSGEGNLLMLEVTDAMHLTVALDGRSASIADARHTAADFLVRVQAEHGFAMSARAMGDTQLVVSELVTNSLKYAPGPVLLELRLDGDHVNISVWDSDPTLPLARAADPGRVGQHGLEIILKLVEAFEVRREPVGKRVTARIALRDASFGGGVESTLL